MEMAEGASAPGALVSLRHERAWRTGIHWTASLLLSAVFLIAGVWTITDPIGAASRLAEVNVPESLSVVTAICLGILETFTGVLLLVPRFRRWGACLGAFLLAVFMIFAAIHYGGLRGVECACFPWVKQAIGPGFFTTAGSLLLVAIGAAASASASNGLRPVAVILGSVTVFALVSFGFASTRHSATPASATAVLNHTCLTGTGTCGGSYLSAG